MKKGIMVEYTGNVFGGRIKRWRITRVSPKGQRITADSAKPINYHNSNGQLCSVFAELRSEPASNFRPVRQQRRRLAA